MKIAIDIMNGDKSPSSSINGAIQYLKKHIRPLIISFEAFFPWDSSNKCIEWEFL